MEKRSKKNISKIILIISIIFVSLIVVTISYYVYSFLAFTNTIGPNNQNETFSNGEALPEYEWEGEEKVHILLLGGDSRGSDNYELPRSDSMVILTIDPITKKGFLHSILRDLYVPIPEKREQKVNAAISLGGPNLAVRTVSEFTGIPIQYYVYTDFEGFIGLIDTLGGIEFYVEKDMDYTGHEIDRKYDIHLKQGLQQLDGLSALQYVRFRYDALSDFARTDRQRQLLKAVAAKLQSSTSILKMPKILKTIAPYIQTNMETLEILKLGKLLYNVSFDNLITQQIPASHLLSIKKIDRGSYEEEVILADPLEVQAYIQQLFAQD